MEAQSTPRHINMLGQNTGNMTSSNLMTEIVSLCPDAIIGVDRKGIITIFNEAAENTTGWSRNDVIGHMSISEFYHCRLEGYETLGQRRDGRLFPIRLSAIILYENGVEVGSVGFFHDLTPRKQLEDELRKLSITDSLTGLYNQRHFTQTMREQIIRAERYCRPLSIVAFDLDKLKKYNDTYGHHEGDRALRLTASCARHAIRESDYAFRQGGDEFALLLIETDLQGGVQVAERFRKSFNKQWSLHTRLRDELLSPITLSLGVAEYRLDESQESLMIRADAAMYHAKRAGGDQTKSAVACLTDTKGQVPN